MSDYQNLGRDVVADLYSIEPQRLQIKFSILSRNYYSYTFSCNFTKRDGIDLNVFLKIPKEDLRKRKDPINYHTEGDRKLALHEINSLRFLNEAWNPIANVSWVKLIGFSANNNAIITYRVFGRDAYKLLRWWDLYRRLGFTSFEYNLNNFMFRLGKSLGAFHRRNTEKKTCNIKTIESKLKHYCSEIKTLKCDLGLYQSLMHVIENIHQRDNIVVMAPTFKGLDIRNIMISPKDNIFLLDPGKLKISNSESDLARLIMTYRIIHWGTKLFIFLRSPSKHAEAKFILGYIEGGSIINNELLNILLLKEILKHWLTACTSLDLKPWPNFLKRIVNVIYIEYFYKSQLIKQIHKINNER
jgi:hypothetical protein